MAESLSGHYSRYISSLENLFLIYFMHIAFFRRKESRSDLNRIRTKHECGCRSPSVTDSACSYDRYFDSVHNLRDERHGVKFSHMTSGLCSFRYHGISTRRLHLQGKSHRCNHRNDLDPGFFPCSHVLCRRPGARCKDLHSFLDHHLRNLRSIRGLKHYIYSKRFVCEFPAFADLVPDSLCSCIN